MMALLRRLGALVRALFAVGEDCPRGAGCPGETCERRQACLAEWAIK